MSVTSDTIELIKTARSAPDDLIKSFIQPTGATVGFQTYNLLAPSLKYTPVLTPLRNSIPRNRGGFAIQANWKTVTDINVGNVRAGVSQGNRGGVITHKLNEYFASFRGFGLENFVTFEANYAAANFEDIKALAIETTLQATMVQEERMILAGNTSLQLGTTPTPTLTTSATGGSLPTGTVSVICVALTLQAYLDVVGVNNGSIGGYFNAATAAVPGTLTRTNADGSSDTFGGGSAAQSANATVAVTGPNGLVAATVAVVNGAIGYAWFTGAAGSEQLTAVTSINSVKITTSPVAGAQTAASLGSADNSTSALEFDGLLTQAFKPGSNAYVFAQPTGVAGVGTPLTSDLAGGVVEIENAFVQFYNRYRISPTHMYVSSQEMENILRKVIQGNGAPLLAFAPNKSDPIKFDAGISLGSYTNKVVGRRVEVVVHPNVPAGTILFYCNDLGMPLSNVSNPVQMLLRQDYYQIDWPVTGRKYTYGVYADGVLQHFAPFSMGVITNIGNG